MIQPATRLLHIFDNNFISLFNFDQIFDWFHASWWWDDEDNFEDDSIFINFMCCRKTKYYERSSRFAVHWRGGLIGLIILHACHEYSPHFARLVEQTWYLRFDVCAAPLQRREMEIARSGEKNENIWDSNETGEWDCDGEFEQLVVGCWTVKSYKRYVSEQRKMKKKMFKAIVNHPRCQVGFVVSVCCPLASPTMMSSKSTQLSREFRIIFWQLFCNLIVALSSTSGLTFEEFKVYWFVTWWVRGDAGADIQVVGWSWELRTCRSLVVYLSDIISHLFRCVSLA